MIKKLLWGLLFIILPTLLALTVIHNRALSQEVQSLQGQLAETEGRLQVLTIQILVVSAYTATKGECNDDPENTAIMEIPRPGGTVAVSRDLKYMLGKDVYIAGLGVRRVNDLMGSGYKGRMDIVMGSKEEARVWGVKELMVVVL